MKTNERAFARNGNFKTEKKRNSLHFGFVDGLGGLMCALYFTPINFGLFFTFRFDR